MAVSPSQIRLSAIFRGVQQYAVSEIGIWAGEPGTAGAVLVLYWSQAEGVLAAKYPNVDFIFSHDLKLTNALPDNALTIQVDPDQSVLLALMAAHEAHSNPHPIYQRQIDALLQRIIQLESKADNIAPTKPTLAIDLPAIITRNSSYTVKFAATDPDGDTVTFNLANVIGCTASQASGITAAGVTLTINPQADTVSFDVTAVDSKGATSTATTVSRTGSAIISLNSPPNAPSIVSDLPATITRNSSYTVKFAATDPDGDTVTFNLANVIGCTASQAGGITSAGVTLSINPQADTVSFDVTAVDSKGATSAATTVSRTGSAIINPTASTGWLATGTQNISVPDWADTATFTGHGGVGVTVCSNDAYGQPDTFISSELLAQSTPAGWLEEAGTSVWVVPYDDGYHNHLFGVLEYNGGKPPPGCYRNSSSVGDYRFFKLINAATNAGDPTKVTGSVTATFTGSAAGSITPPAQTTQIKPLPGGSGRSLTVVIPTTGALKIDWS